MSVAVTDAAAWLAVILALGAGVLAFAMLRSRSLFVTAAAIAAMSALAAGALVLLGGGDGAVALAAFGVGVAPVLLLGGVLLSARTAKGRSGWIIHGAAIAAAVAAAAVIAPEWSPRLSVQAAQAPAGLWLGILVFVAACVCVALLGYGERGVLERRQRGPEL